MKTLVYHLDAPPISPMIELFHVVNGPLIHLHLATFFPLRCAMEGRSLWSTCMINVFVLFTNLTLGKDKKRLKTFQLFVTKQDFDHF